MWWIGGIPPRDARHHAWCFAKARNIIVSNPPPRSTSVERYFPSEKQVLIRETSSGTSVRAYFLGKNVAHFPFILVAPVFFAVFYVAFAAPRCSALDLYSGLLAIVWSCTGAGYLLSMTFNNKAQLACTVFPLIATMFAGVNPTLTNLKETSFIGYAVSTVSYAR